MDEEFLSTFRASPSPDFSNDLYARLNQAARQNELRRTAATRRTILAVACTFLALALLMVFSPAARTAARNFIDEVIAKITYKNTTVYINSGSIDISKLPQQTESYNSVWAPLSPAQVSSDYPLFARLPKWVPSGYMLQEKAILAFATPSFDHPPLYSIYQWKNRSGSRIELMVYRGTCPSDRSLIDCASQWGISVPASGDPQVISVNGQPGILVNSVVYMADLASAEKSWNPERGLLVPQAQFMSWSGDQTTFLLVTDSLKISRKDLLRLAGSIPGE